MHAIDASLDPGVLYIHDRVMVKLALAIERSFQHAPSSETEHGDTIMDITFIEMPVAMDIRLNAILNKKPTPDSFLHNS